MKPLSYAPAAARSAELSVREVTAHYPLDAIKALVLERGLNTFTQSASDNARLMGLDRMAAVSVVLGLQRACCSKA